MRYTVGNEKIFPAIIFAQFFDMHKGTARFIGDRNMSFVQVAVIAAVIPALVNFVLHRFAQGDGSDEGSVHMPKAFFWLAALAASSA